MRPVGSDDRPITPRHQNVGDGRAPSADIRVLKNAGKPSGSAAGGSPAQAGAQAQASAAARPAAGTVASASRQSASSAGMQASAAAAPIPVRASPVPSAAWNPGSAAAELRASLGLPSDGASYAAMAAMMGERMPMDAKTALAIRRAARLRNDDPAAARLAARALAAGLDPDDPSVRKVIDAVGSRRSDVGDGGPDTGSDGGSDGGAPSGYGGQPGRDAPRDRQDPGFAAAEAAESESGNVDPHELARRLAMSAVAALGDPDLAALAAPGPDGSGWACVPFETSVAGMNFHGFYRIWYYSKGGPVGRLVADIRFGDQRRLLELRGRGGDAGIAYYADDERERDAFLTEFGGTRDVSASRIEEGDLFELVSRRSVDEDA